MLYAIAKYKSTIPQHLVGLGLHHKGRPHVYD